VRGAWTRESGWAALVLTLLGAVVVGLLLAPTAAQAETVPATCTDVQEVINIEGTKPSHGEGDVVVLSGLCNAALLKSANGVTIPSESDLTLEGAPGTTSGFDGTGVVGGPLLATAGFEEASTITLRNLTFQHASFKGNGGALSLRARTGVTLSGDSFLENTTTGVTAGAAFVYVGSGQVGCPPSSGPPGVTIIDSTFRANTLEVGGGVGAGGGAWVQDACQSARNLLQDNVFEDNTLAANGSEQVVGAGLAFSSSAATPPALTQLGNVFSGNRIVDVAGTGKYGGGGEWVEGVSLTSVGDRFSGNTLPGTEGSYWSWGAGLGIVACNSTTPSENTLENAVVVGNSIVAGTPATAGGAGIYSGCGFYLTTPDHLRLLDSTVTENSVPSGGVAGIDGKPSDQLYIANSIVAADSGGAEIGGFTGPSGSLATTFSDVCAAGSSTALAGTGNICANPLLVDAGNPASFDVHETASSPTIDAGSSELVPAGLTTDFYGGSRELPAFAHFAGCGPGAAGVPPAVVDMGASEAAPAAPPAAACPCFCFGPQLKSITKTSVLPAATITRRAGGLLILSFNKLAVGKLAVIGTFKVTKTVLATVKGHRKRIHKLETVLYGHASYTVSSPGNVTIRLKPSKRALALLAARKHLQVLLSITFTATGELPVTHEQTITVRYVKPRVKHRG
jgi:hypothetical protein